MLKNSKNLCFKQRNWTKLQCTIIIFYWRPVWQGYGWHTGVLSTLRYFSKTSPRLAPAQWLTFSYAVCCALRCMCYVLHVLCYRSFYLLHTYFVSVSYTHMPQWQMCNDYHNDKLVKGKLRHVEHFKCLSEKKIYYKWAALNWKLLGKLHEKELGEKRF